MVVPLSIVVLVFCFFWTVESISLPQAEYEALYSLYNATNGDYWTWSTRAVDGIPWAFTPGANPCTDKWQGVICTVDTSPPPAKYHISQLSLSSMNMRGYLPSSLENLNELQDLKLGTNALTGTIPQTYCRFQQLSRLVLESNQLTGKIPGCIGNLTLLQLLYVNENTLTGYLPDSIGSLTSLRSMMANYNQLSGPLPVSLGSARELVTIYVDHNLLTGTIPPSVGNLTKLQYFTIGYNSITGSVPESIGVMTQLRYLYAQYNLFTGTLPAAMGNFSLLLTLFMNNNLLTGSIPASFSGLTLLSGLGLQANYLVGPLEGVFSAAQRALVAVTIGGNQFTGTLPSTIFDLPALQSISIIGSCMHGTLPDNICQATQLEALILYGLTTGDSCRGSGLVSRRNFGGTFPSCLLTLPNLGTLLLSSNGLTGSIASNVVVGQFLFELDLSHNDLSGPIPHRIQNQSWFLLDLSHNKLNGVLQADLFITGNISLAVETHGVSFTPGQDVSLSSNRLSGPVPSSLLPLHNSLSVLAGNLFECKYDKSDLPQHDSDISNYQCASNSFDLSIYVWLGLGVVAALIAVIITAYHSQWSLSSQLSDACATQLVHVMHLLEKYQAVSHWSWGCAAFCMLLLLPYYAIVSHYEGTHTHQYAYVLSAIYVSGVAPFVVDVLLLGALISLLFYVGRSIVNDFTAAVTGTAAVDVSKQGRFWPVFYVWCIFACANVTVVLGANVAFVYVVLYRSSQLQTLAQVLLSLFKLMWTAAVSPIMIRRLSATFIPPEGKQPEPFFTLQLLVALFNNIAIPCLVVAAIDPNCFSNILLPPQVQTVSFLEPSCIVPAHNSDSNSTCYGLVYGAATLQYTPPFTYSYQCSASFITSYAPTFIYMSMSTVFLSPLLQYVLLKLHERLPAGRTTQKLVSRFVSRILKPPVSEIDNSGVSRPIVGAVGVLVTLLTQLGILLSFGAIFPPVALAMAVSISAVVFMTRYKAQRYVHAAVETQQLPVLDIINAECERVGTREQMRTAVVINICYCCAFYAMFLFDTLGDAVGFDASVWVLIVVPLTPLAILGCVTCYNKRTIRARAEEGVAIVGPGLELKAVSDKKGFTRAEGDNGGITVNVLHDNV